VELGVDICMVHADAHRALHCAVVETVKAVVLQLDACIMGFIQDSTHHYAAVILGTEMLKSIVASFANT